MLRVPEKPVICNNSPLVALWTLDLLFLLRELYTEVLIPEEVQDEFFATEQPVRRDALKNSPWIRAVNHLKKYKIQRDRNPNEPKSTRNPNPTRKTTDLVQSL